MKDGQNGGGSVNPLESEGNIYQHAAQSIEGNENRLPAKLGANLGTDDRATANSEGPEEEVRFDGSHNGRSDALAFRQIVEVGENAVGVLVAIVENFFGELLIAVAGIQRAEDLGPAGFEGRFILVFAFDKDKDFIGLGTADILDALDFRVAKPLGGQAAAEPVNIGGLREAYVHVCATTKINPVLDATSEENRSPPGEKKNATQDKEILGFAHPVDVGLLEEFDHSAIASLP